MEDKCEGSPPLRTLINKESQWLTKKDEERRHGSSEEKKLELRLAPPGQDWSNTDITNKKESEHQSLLCLGYSSSTSGNGNQTHPWTRQNNQHTSPSPFLHSSSTATAGGGGVPNPQACLPVTVKESSQPCSTKVVNLQNAEKKAFSPSPANTAVPNTSQKRSASGPVVGWPPIRSYRKNLGSSSCSKAANVVQSSDQKAAEATCRKSLFVKINMDGVPIGRKVDLKTYDSYEKLSTAVDQLFRGLLAAQRDLSAGGIINKAEEEKAITSKLDGSGEYTLVYEDNEGDRMLVGDVPWHMFVSTVKRLRVLKTSELSALSLGSSKQDKIPT